MNESHTWQERELDTGGITESGMTLTPSPYARPRLWDLWDPSHPHGTPRPWDLGAPHSPLSHWLPRPAPPLVFEPPAKTCCPSPRRSQPIEVGPILFLFSAFFSELFDPDL